MQTTIDTNIVSYDRTKDVHFNTLKTSDRSLHGPKVCTGNQRVMTSGQMSATTETSPKPYVQ